MLKQNVDNAILQCQGMWSPISLFKRLSECFRMLSMASSEQWKTRTYITIAVTMFLCWQQITQTNQQT